MRIIIACGLDSRSRAGFWKNDRAAVHAVRTIQYNNLLFYLLLIIIIYYSSDLPSSLINESLSVLSTQSLSSLSSTSSSHTMSSSDQPKALLNATLLERSDDNALWDGFPCSWHPPCIFPSWRLTHADRCLVSATVERCFHQLQKLQRLCSFPSPLRTE